MESLKAVASNSGKDMEEATREEEPKLGKSTSERDGYQFDTVVVEANKFAALDLPQKESILHPWVQNQSIILISGWRGVGKT
jgi:chromosomal replication initiation ATPase DnaA